MAKGILIAAMDFTNVAADEFNDWYDNEHVPERRNVPGFLRLQRWIGAEQSSRFGRRHYDLESLDVLQRVSADPRNRRREPLAVVEAGDRAKCNV